ncbi:MAG: hypothetical protein MI749_17860 [Desulfovibrionales bacterium]|nr:hypothetical protein [Desulfovibrionales bacterium]
MFKIVVLFFVIVWIMSLFMSKRKKVIRDSNQLVQLILSAAIIFSGITMLRNSELATSAPLYLLSLIGLFLSAWFLAKFFLTLISKKK